MKWNMFSLNLIATIALIAGCQSGKKDLKEDVSEKTSAEAPAMPPETAEDAGESAEKAEVSTAAVAEEPKKEEPKPEAKPASKSANTFAVVPTHLNVRKGPGMGHEVIRTVKKGEKLQVAGKENDIWAKIGDGEYVSTHHLEESD